MKTIPSRVMTVALAALLSASPASSQDTPEKPRSKSPQVEVIRLQYAVADEVLPLLVQSLPPSLQRGTKIAADPRTNSLVVSSEEGDLKDLKSVVALLDVAAVPAAKPAAPARRSVTYEVVLFMTAPGSEEALQLPRTSTGVIDASDPEPVLAKLRAGVGKTGGVAEVAKLSVSADEYSAWKARQAIQVPIVNEGNRGNQAFGGYQEAVLDFSVTPQTSKGPGPRRLGISCRIERFADAPKLDAGPVMPPAKNSNQLEFSTSVDDGKLVLAAVESAASKFDVSYFLFVRVKA